MARQAGSRKSRGCRDALCCEAVVAAAVRIADEHGVEAVSMRSLAAELGVEAMSLYSHVPSKEVLLGLMAARVIGQVPTPPRKLPPRKRLCMLGMGMRKVARAHPHVFPLVVLMPLELEASLRPVEIALQAFVDAGLGDERAIRSQRVLLSYLRGYLLWEIGGFAAGRWRDARGRLSPRALSDLAALDRSRFPESTRMAATFLRIKPDRAFEDGLGWVLDSLLPEARARGARRRRTA